MSSCNSRFTMHRIFILRSFRLQMLILLSCYAISHGVQSDIDCLKSIKESLEDPEYVLSSWDFSNQTEGFICRFAGIECWHPDESKVLNIGLSDMGLRGPFPTGIRHCSSMSGLNLSSNYLTGSLPSNLRDIIGFTTTLDLSNNSISGPIPPSITNLSYINVLRLDNNQLTGQIPPLLGNLNRLKELSVANNRLSGPIPHSIVYCTRLNVLRLDNNRLTGQIPPLLGNLNRLKELSVANNRLSGPIPHSIVYCTRLNVLRLDNNRLTGRIPQELSQFDHIKEFSVADNTLTGTVPTFPHTNFSAESYANNQGLCGGPLSPCKNEEHDDLFFPGFAVGFPVSTLLSTFLMFYCLPRLSMSNIRLYLIMIKKIKGMKCHMIPSSPQILFTEENSSEEIKVTAMEKYICRVSLVELEMATNDFHSKKVIGYGNMGLLYKAMFPNGLTLAVKRLHKFESFNKEFLLEIEILGRLRHTNLVPLLGFCFEMEKKFLVYKYMSNRTLHQWLHSRPQVDGKKMGWTLRFKIALGIARGLAWLHHNNVLRVAHRKISSNCILLDDEFEPKISNFGNSNILMNTSGTPSSGSNYLVPDLSHVDYKEDVYSFGILLLELICGKEPSTWINSVTHYVCDEDFIEVDECLMEQGFGEEINETLRIAENCIQSHRDGATTMLQAYQAMRAIRVPRNELSENFCMDVEDNEGDM